MSHCREIRSEYPALIFDLFSKYIILKKPLSSHSCRHINSFVTVFLITETMVVEIVVDGHGQVRSTPDAEAAVAGSGDHGFDLRDPPVVMNPRS